MVKPYFLENMVSQSKNGKLYISLKMVKPYFLKNMVSQSKNGKLDISLKMVKPYFLKNMVSQSKNGSPSMVLNHFMVLISWFPSRGSQSKNGFTNRF